MMMRSISLLVFCGVATVTASFCEEVELTTDNLIRGEQGLGRNNAFQLNPTPQNTPPTTTGTAVIFYDGDQQRIWWQIDVENVAPGVQVTAAHFHVGGPDATGPVEISLLEDNILTDNIGPNMIPPQPLSGRMDIEDPVMLTNLLSGNWYINVHTISNPATGEIRGQILARETAVHESRVPLTTQAQIAAGQVLQGDTSQSTGRAELQFDVNTNRLCWAIAYAGLSSETTIAHFHGPATAQQTNDVLISISDGPFPDPHVGFATVQSGDVQDLLVNDLWYINIHTATNGGGEIRGQVTRAGFELVDPAEEESDPNAQDNGSFCESVQLSTTAVTIGSPAGRVPVSADLSFGEAFITYDGVTSTVFWRIETQTGSPITQAHFHLGDANSEGPVQLTIVDLNTPDEPNADRNMFPSPLEGQAVLNQAAYSNLVGGNWYINIHTEQNPAGELRGQIIANEGPVMRTKVSLTTDANVFGNGVMPLININNNAIDAADSAGAAVVLYTQSTSQLCWAVTYTSLSSPVTQAHFHGPAGPDATGGVVHFIFNGTVSSPHVGSVTILPGQELDLINGQWYINVHTENNPQSGEIRGQVDDFVTLTPQPVTPVVVDIEGNGASSLIGHFTSMALVVASTLAFTQSL